MMLHCRTLDRSLLSFGQDGRDRPRMAVPFWNP